VLINATVQSRTVLQYTVLVRQLSSYVERRAGLYFTGTVATEQSRSQPGGLQNMGYNVARLYIPDKDVDELRQRLLNVRSSIEQDVIDASIDQWHVDSKHACVREADILNTCCKFVCTDIRTSR